MWNITYIGIKVKHLFIQSSSYLLNSRFRCFFSKAYGSQELHLFARNKVRIEQADAPYFDMKLCLRSANGAVNYRSEGGK